MTQLTMAERGGVLSPCEERAGGRMPPSEDVRLSIAHTDGLSPSAPPHPDTSSVWTGAALAKFPPGENRNPNVSKLPPKRGIRGKIVMLSRGVRQRIKEFMAKIADVPCFTMALTLPEECSHVTPEKVHETFKRFTKAYTGTPRWDDVGIVWKREFQDNGRLHYHLACYGLGNLCRAVQLQTWITYRWVRWIMEEAKLGPETDRVARSKMMKVHLHPKNMERVRSTICSYFAKYLGKAVNAPRIEVPGKWWGVINEKAIPIVEEKTLVLPPYVRNRSRRSASKLQSKRIQHALFVNAMRKAKLMVTGEDGKIRPAMSLQQFHQAKHFVPDCLAEETPRQNLLWCHYEMRKKLLADGYRPGSHNRPRHSKFGTITLVGFGVPAIYQRIIKHAADMWKDHRQTHPF